MAKMLRALIIFALLDAFYVDAFLDIPVPEPAKKTYGNLRDMYAAMNKTKPRQYLEAHNKIRLEMGVPPLKWDRKLTRQSRRYANSQAHICHLDHSHSVYGENLAWEQYDEATPGDIIQKFIDERANYDLETGVCNCQPSSTDCMCGHFTQVIWRTTERVGCAEVTCKGQKGKLVVCSYDPRGNYIGQNPLSPLE
ncbi:Pathogenesis-related protein 1B [Heracleum sosnowskyi]|uniref:Pathogenesis-related protein 1B n=1 Tax=Heracleum sosnowskyi TaxID=360622 RepID=A0AAD8M529_9APIA|nr:Pathogenesis-related protein 1B [Heracleum sosnowskyi]